MSRGSLRSGAVVVPRTRPDLADLPAYRPGRPLQAGTAAAGETFVCSSNENPYPPLPSVVEAVHRAATGINRYPDLACTELSSRLAEHLAVPVDHLVVGPGSVGVLQQAVSAVAGAGDEVVFAWRSFEAYPIVTRVAGATAVPVPLTPDGRHDIAAMTSAVTDRTRLVLVCTPNNPTGPAVTAAELDQLLASLPEDLPVVVDEAYAEFVRAEDAADGLRACREHPNVVALRTFSKAYGLAGLRVGYAVAVEPVAAALRATGIPFGVSSVAQAAAVESLRHTGELMGRVQALVSERDRVVAGLSERGWRLPDTEANFVWFGLGDGAQAFADELASAGLSARIFPGEGVRVTIAEPEANDRLLSVAASFPRRH